MDLRERVDQVVRALHGDPAGRRLGVSALTVSQGAQTGLRYLEQTNFALVVPGIMLYDIFGLWGRGVPQTPALHP